MSSNSFDRLMCEMLSTTLTVEFEEREADIKAQGDQRALKRVEKRRAKAEKKLKKTRDETETENTRRYLKQYSLHVFDNSIYAIEPGRG